jgi:hypothetical protein
MKEQDLINAGFTRRDVSKEESGNDKDFHYYFLDVVDGITLVSDSTEEINGDNWTVDCFEVDKILIKDAESLFSFLETLKICTQVNL